jgi:hypothetical protein
MGRFRPRRRRPPLRPFCPWVALLTATALTGCSGTRFGDQLARSFSAPPAAPATQASSGTSTEASKPAQQPARPSGAATPSGTAPGGTASPAAQATKAPVAGAGAGAAARPVPRPPAPPSAPAPYRVTIRLPAADPSAPAEQVTEVLRAAGVPFEVETIERIGSSAGSATSPVAPLRTPAPAPR